NPEYPWEAMGNACEDIAWFLGENHEYAEAVQAFNVAINRLTSRFSERKQPLVSRGRCEYRWALSKSPPDQKHLGEALVDLRQVANSEAAVAERVEAYYFLGLVQQLLAREKGNAESSLEHAVALDEENNLGLWASYALDNLGQLKIQQGDWAGARKVAQRLE